MDFDLGGFEPCNGVHAIVACSVSINFARQFPSEQWDALKSAALSIADKFELGVPQPFYGLSVQFQPAKVNIALNAPQLGIMDAAGLVFARLGEGNDLSERIIISHEGVIFLNASYVRWAPFFSRIKGILEILYPWYLDTAPFGSIKTEYWDRFDQSSDALPDATKIINSSSGMIASTVINPDTPWHSEAARFVRASDTVRRLEQVRVDAIEAPTPSGTRRSLSIYTMMEDAVNAPGFLETGNSEVPLDRALGIMQDQHVALKRLIHGVITPHASDRLGLEIF